MTQPTPYPEANRLLDALQSRLQALLNDRLVGLYVFGSLVIDAYTPGCVTASLP